MLKWLKELFFGVANFKNQEEEAHFNTWAFGDDKLRDSVDMFNAWNALHSSDLLLERHGDCQKDYKMMVRIWRHKSGL